MEPEAGTLELFELSFSDLLLLSSLASNEISPSTRDLIRLQSISAAVMRTLGPSGPGLLSISGIPKAAALRRSLLPLARKLALLGHKDRVRVLKKHGLGSDVSLKNLGRSVSSFALLLRYAGESRSVSSSSTPDDMEKDKDNVERNPIIHMFQDFNDDDFEQLGDYFKELGLCMMELGIHLARVCDMAIGSKELERSIVESGSAKGRLIHYHSALDNITLKETCRRTKASMKKVGPNKLCHSLAYKSRPFCNSPTRLEDMILDEQTPLKQENMLIRDKFSTTSFSNLWQQWHYDYGIFTVLTAPMFFSSYPAEDCSYTSISQECPSPDRHTYLQLFDTKKNKVFVVKSSPENFIIQVGEAADILSRGELRSTLHSVGRPLELGNISRETFVVFLQPAWDKTLSYSGYSLDAEDETNSEEKLASRDGPSEPCKRDLLLSSDISADQSMQEILKKIPPLTSRLKDGMTFAEFSRETTKQYYGGSGTQCRN
ncbi:uncharacterized protein [Typha angustifolia]|uniref:uncharacterized protein n=1 Tax=Typha angustifolia TaxID=59011 RepID=UPI003C2EF195